MAGAAVIFSLLILFLYVFIILRYRQGFKKYPDFFAGKGIDNSPISVVIAFRNEAANIEYLLKALADQNYPEHLFEVILVDDHSNDGSGVIASNHCNNNANYRYLINGPGQTGKKAALREGILSAKNELIVTTDADCTMGPDWLYTLAGFYQSENPDMIIGLVVADSPVGFFGKFMETEFSALIATGAGAASIGKPIYCNAANLAFKRSAYLNFTDPALHLVASGDDTFLLHHLIKTGKKVALLKSSGALVRTQLPENWRSFFQQRIRWASKSRFYRDINATYAAMVVLAVNLVILFSVFMVFSKQYQWLFPVLFGVKYLTDYLLAESFYSYLSKRIEPGRFIIYSVMYPLVTVVVALAGIRGSFSWKGRHYRFGSKLVSQF